MRTIHKYNLLIEEVTTVIHLPKYSSPLCVQIQGGIPCMWVWVDTSYPVEERTFHCICTGQDIKEDIYNKLSYISTFQDGSLVFHVFEEVK